MSDALHNINRQIADVSAELGVRRDIHGKGSDSYKTKRAELADLKNRRREIKIEMALSAGGVLA